MFALTIHLPDEKHERLEALARANSVSLDRLMDDLATAALAGFDAKERFEVRAHRGDAEKGLALLDKLDRAE